VASRRLLLGALPLLLSACALSSGDLGGTGPITPGSVIPVATSVGLPQGPPSIVALATGTGALRDPSGQVTVSVPAGSAAPGTVLSIVPISSRAPGAMGGSFRIEATPALLGPVQVSFTGLGYYPSGISGRSLAVRWQDARGFWVAPDATSYDAATDTVTATTSHLSDWTLVLADPPDLTGTFTLEQTVGIPFSATGTAALYTLPVASEPTYFLTGTITIPPSLTFGDAICVPDAQTKNLELSVAEIHDAVLRWGLNGLWTLTCTNQLTGAVVTQDLATQFDTMHINLVRCGGKYVGTQVNGSGFVQGAYTIDCSGTTGGSVTATWDFRGCTAGGTCAMPNPCVLGTVVCSGGVGSCAAAGFAPAGTACGSGLACDGAGTCQ
jgi:hypothetical protein